MATDTSKSGMARKTATKPAKPATKRAADGFIMMAMAVVTLALCIGLVTQVGMSFWLAVTVSAAFYMGLLTLHTLVRRHDQLDDMKSEIDRLTKEVARLQNSAPSSRPAPSPAPNAFSAPEDQSAIPPRALAQSAAPGSARPGRETAGVTGTPQYQPPHQPPRAASAPGPKQPDPARTAAPPASSPVARAATPPNAPVVRAPNTKAPSPQTPPSSSGSSVSVGGKPDGAPGNLNASQATTTQRAGKAEEQPKRKGSIFGNGLKRLRGKASAEEPEEQTTHDNATPQAGANPELSQPNAPAATVDHASPAGSPAIQPPPTKTAAVQTPDQGRAPRSFATGRARGENAPNQNQPAMPPRRPGQAEQSKPHPEDEASADFAFRPGDAREATVSPSESDVEMIQSLIKKLADEVNSADANKLSANRSSDALHDEALDRSVGALRQAARNMQEPPFTGPDTASGDAFARKKTKPDATNRMTAEHAAASRTTPPASFTDAPGITATGREPGISLPGGKADSGPGGDAFDIEAVMARAKPIATMTSMPPPLPQAPNAMAPNKPKDQTAAPSINTDRHQQSALPLPDQNDAAMEASALDDFWDYPDASFEAPPPQDTTQRRLARIASAIEEGRIDILLEPILDLEQQQARHYEVGVRLRDQDGLEIAPDDPEEADRPSGALPLLDSLRLKRTAQVARRLDERKKSGNVFSNFSGQSLTSDSFLSTFADAYDAQSQLAGQLVLTFSQDDARRFTNPHWTMINEMRGLGFGFALRAVTDLDMDFEILANAGFEYVKLDAEVFLSGLPAPEGPVPAADLCKHFSQLGLTTVVEALDDETKREKVYAYGVRFGQGPLFGGPRVVKTSGSAHTSAAA